MDLQTFTVLAAIAPVVVACHYYRQTQNPPQEALGTCHPATETQRRPG